MSAPQTPPADPGAPAGQPSRSGWSDRVLGLRGVVAVALASVILGAAGGAVLGQVSDGQQGGPGGMRGGFPGFPAGGPGGLPGGTRGGFPGTPAG